MAVNQRQHSHKLAVILHADVVKSTALVQLNESLARERISYAFNRLSEFVDRYGGESRELRGDALVAEFGHASDAVCAALGFQQRHTKFLKRLGDEIRPYIRTGVSLGEVAFTDNAVMGERVVLAQRVEQLAEPGGLCITGAIHDALPKRMPLDQESLVEQELKGFDDKVGVYRVGLKPGESVPPPKQTGKTSFSLRGWRGVVAGVVTLLAIVGGVLLWFEP